MLGKTADQTGAATTAAVEDRSAAFRAALEVARRRRSRRTLVLIVAACAIAVGGTTYRRMTRRKEALRDASAAWDRYARCLVGAPLAPGEAPRTRLLRMELSLPEAAGAMDKQDWPLRCTVLVEQLHRAIKGRLDDQPAYRRLDALATRASATQAVTWSAEADLPEELWSAARAADLPPPSAASTTLESPLSPPPAPPLAAHPMTATSLPPLPVPVGSTVEPQDGTDPSKVVVGFTRPHAPTTLCAFGPGAQGAPLASVRCEDGAGVLLERRPAPGAFVRTAAGHFDRFELVRPRTDKEPWVDALSPETRAAALFGEQLVYVKPGPEHPDLLFARTASIVSAGQTPMADPVPLGELEGRAHELATCMTREALVVRVRSYDGHLGERGSEPSEQTGLPGQSWARFAFYGDGAWSPAPPARLANNAAQLTCRAREGTLTWFDSESIVQVRCDASQCTELSSGPLHNAWTHMQRLAAADLDGKALLVGIADGSGPFSASLVHSVRMRLARVDQIASAPDVVLWGDAQHEGGDPTAVRLLVGQGAALVIVATSDGANRAIRIDPSGSFEGVEIGKN
jgi:hypothetical protein